MPVIARDNVASDHLVFAWPFPIGPEEYEVSCANDELVVMCPSFMVGDRLGPGRHRWRTPDPMRPVSAYFVLTAPVEVSFDLLTAFLIPNTGQHVRLRANGSLQVRCVDPALLIAQFVGLPFDHVNDGVLRSVSRSIERMLARLLTRRVVMAGTPNAVTDPHMLGNIAEELIAYNPAAGAVFGIELARIGHMAIYADDGTRPWQHLGPSGSNPHIPANGGRVNSNLIAPITPQPEHQDLVETARGTPKPPVAAPAPRVQSSPQLEASGEIVIKDKARSDKPTSLGHAAPNSAHRIDQTPVPARNASTIDVPSDSKPTPPQTQSAILGIGMAPIGAVPAPAPPPAGAPMVAAGELPLKIAPGRRVLVPGPGGLMQSATVRQLLQGYYELEVGGSGETIWVPMNGVVPE